MKKVTREEFQDRVASKGFVIGSDYIGTMQKCTTTCQNGHKWSVRPYSLLAGKGCPYCFGNSKVNLEEFQKRIVHIGFIAHNDYTNTHTKCSISCSEGHVWKATPTSILGGNKCPHCARVAPISREALQSRIAYRKIIVGNDYKNMRKKCTFTCENNHSWETTPNNVSNGTNCPHCEIRTSDRDAVYIWRSEGETFQGRQVYKVGITSDRLKDIRIRQVKKRSGRNAKIEILQKVENAVAVEAALKTFGVDPQFTGFDGATEFRAMDEDEFSRAIAFVKWSSKHEGAL